MSWGFHGGRFVNGRPASQLPGVQEIRDTSATFAEVWTASSAVAILLHMTDLCNTHAHVRVLADYEAEERKIDPSEFYPGKCKNARLTIMPVISAYSDGILAFEARMNVSFAESTRDPITALFFEIDQNGKHPLGSVKKVLDWINVDLDLGLHENPRVLR